MRLRIKKLFNLGE